MISLALDTNCFIDAYDRASHSHGAISKIFAAGDHGKVRLSVSLHTLHELEVKKGKPFELASRIQRLDHFSIGTWDEQVGTWKQSSGTWADAKRHDQMQEHLRGLAKAKTSIRDRGAFIDALANDRDIFVTSDKQFVGSGPQPKINAAFKTRVLSPQQVVEELSL